MSELKKLRKRVAKMADDARVRQQRVGAGSEYQRGLEDAYREVVEEIDARRRASKRTPPNPH